MFVLLDTRCGGAGEIVVSVDSSGDGWGGFLAQRDEENDRQHPARYERRRIFAPSHNPCDITSSYSIIRHIIIYKI